MAIIKDGFKGINYSFNNNSNNNLGKITAVDSSLYLDGNSSKKVYTQNELNNLSVEVVDVLKNVKNKLETKTNKYGISDKAWNSELVSDSDNNSIVSFNDISEVAKKSELVDPISEEARNTELVSPSSINEINNVVLENQLNINSSVDVDISKYNNYKQLGFVVTTNNKIYKIDEDQLDFFAAVVCAEVYDEPYGDIYNDALGVSSVVLNRCDYVGGDEPYNQLTKSNQFEGYFSGGYLNYMPGGESYDSEKRTKVLSIVKDALNGVRNVDNLYFTAASSDKSIFGSKQINEFGNIYYDVDPKTLDIVKPLWY